jgi:hypothetical protein
MALQYQGSYPPLMGGPNTIPYNQGIYEQSISQNAPLGARLVYGNRSFVYCKAGEGLTSGNLLIMAAMVANHINIPCVVGSGEVGIAGKRKVAVTLGATLATVNQYADGYLHMTDADQEGRTYMIQRHPAADLSTDLTLDLYDALVEDIAVTTEVHLETNPFLDVIEHNAAIVECPVGVPHIDITDNYFFWAQYWGPCAVLAEANPVLLGEKGGPSGSTDGAVEACESAETPIVGFARVLNVSTEYSPLYLTILI